MKDKEPPTYHFYHLNVSGCISKGFLKLSLSWILGPLKFLYRFFNSSQGDNIKRTRGDLISILQEIQREHGYISQEAISNLADELNCSEHEIYGVATFYTQFRLSKPAKHLIKVCLGTACHVKGGEAVMEAAEREITRDFGLERVACMGCCALSPVMRIDEDIYGNVSPTKVKEIISKYQKA
jgi:NADH-quinone oxidoreductase subunit E